MSWLAILFAATGAALILGALTYVSILLGVLITAMIILMCGPLIDRLVARRNRRSA
jgi:predicted PurR-regulated permease PerM